MNTFATDSPTRDAAAASQRRHDPRAAERPVARSQLTRILHLLLLAIVLHQLIGSQVMSRPFPGDPPGTAYALHRYLGLASVAVVGAFWLWTLVRRGETRLGRLFPWFSARRLRAAGADLAWQVRRLAHRRMPDDADGAFASTVHGLGLLAVTAMALTGGVYFFLDGGAIAHAMLRLHKLISNLAWAYLCVHVGLAALHHLLGSDILSRMFWPSRRT